MSITSNENKIFSSLRENGLAVVADGVVCEQEFLNARYKIVYILKEANGGDNWDLRDFVRDGGRAQTWNNIARWTQGVLSWEKEFPWSEMSADNEQRRLTELKKIAVVNLKKTSGGHTANFKEISKSAFEYTDIIKKQLSLYNADLIICCGTANAFVSACYKDRNVDWNITSRDVNYFNDKKTTVIAFSHPEARVNDAYLFYALTDAIKEIMNKESLR